MTSTHPEGALEVCVERTWDGLAADVQVRMRLDLGAEVLRIDVDAPFHDDPPPEGPPGSTDRLWEHEVVELFLVDRTGRSPRYTEIELGPHGHYLVLRLDGVRAPVEVGAEIGWETRRSGGRWTGEAVVPRVLLPAALTHFNAYAIFGEGEARTYLAATPVPGPAPDFHRLEHFAAWPGTR